MSTKLKPIETHPKPIDPGVDIGHVHLKTADLRKVYDFYVGVLGFEVVMEMPTALFLSAGGYHHHLAFNTWESEGGQPAPRNTTGLYHVAIRYPSREALGDALHRLRDADWPLEGVNDHGTHEALYLRDPDDNGLELYWDRPVSDWPLNAQGHLTFGGKQLDLAGLLKAGEPKT
jgi:catechol 2,3-dioxygenase